MTTMRAGLRSNLRARMRCASRALRNMEQAQPRASRGCLCSSFPLGGIADMIRCLPPKAPTLARTSSSAAGNCENTRLFSSGAALLSSSRRRSRASTFVHHAPSTCSVYVYNKRASSVVVGSWGRHQGELSGLLFGARGMLVHAHKHTRPPAHPPACHTHACTHPRTIHILISSPQRVCRLPTLTWTTCLPSGGSSSGLWRPLAAVPRFAITRNTWARARVRATPAPLVKSRKRWWSSACVAWGARVRMCARAPEPAARGAQHLGRTHRKTRT